MALDNDTELDDKIHKSITARIGRLNIEDLVARAVQTALEAHQSKVQSSSSVAEVKSSPEKDEIAKLRQEMADKEAKAAAKFKGQQEKQALLSLRSELKGKVINDMDDVVADYMFSKQMVSVDENGDTKIKVGEELYEPADAVKKFLSSKEGKRFAAASDAQRSTPKPVLDRPAPSGTPLMAGAGVNSASVTNDILADVLSYK